MYLLKSKRLNCFHLTSICPKKFNLGQIEAIYSFELLYSSFVLYQRSRRKIIRMNQLLQVSNLRSGIRNDSFLATWCMFSYKVDSDNSFEEQRNAIWDLLRPVYKRPLSNFIYCWKIFPRMSINIWLYGNFINIIIQRLSLKIM